MKSKLLWISCLFGLCISCSKQQPAVTPVPPVEVDTLNSWVKMSHVTGGVYDIWFSVTGKGIITNDTFLLNSPDGNSWTQIAGTSHLYLFNLQFLDDLNGFAQGDKQLGFTLDGGTTWTFNALPSTSAFNFQFLTTQTGFIYDSPGNIYKTSDAGLHWKNMGNPANYKIHSFYFLDSLNGYLISAGGFNKTINGGVSWAQVSSGTFPATVAGFYKMQFLDTLHGYSCSTTGLYKTVDGGVTWKNILPAAAGFMVPYFFDLNNGYCLVDGEIYKTTDGGQNWIRSCKLANDRFSGMHMFTMNSGWACTFGGYVLRLQ
jgi:photosystem II stability/assembly factor-like uncharacterized protein